MPDLVHEDASTDEEIYLLTTEDNPFSPFDEFHQWWTYDELHGHHTCGLLAKYIVTSTNFPQWMQDEARHTAIDLILEEAIHAKFKKVKRSDYPQASEEVEEVSEV